MSEAKTRVVTINTNPVDKDELQWRLYIHSVFDKIGKEKRKEIIKAIVPKLIEIKLLLERGIGND